VTWVDYIFELQNVIQEFHGVRATYVESVPVTEISNGRTVWDGKVEVFDLEGHPEAPRVYAWKHATSGSQDPNRHVTVLHIPPVVSAEAAVKAANSLRSTETAAQEKGELE
jgi:hypothetical protein